MPGMDGWTVLNALKADPELAQIPVILLTISDERRRASVLGAAEFLQKPVERARLAAVLQRYQPGGLARPVLVVDDHPASHDMAARVPGKRFGSVIEAEDGRAALERLARQKPGLNAEERKRLRSGSAAHPGGIFPGVQLGREIADLLKGKPGVQPQVPGGELCNGAADRRR